MIYTLALDQAAIAIIGVGEMPHRALATLVGNPDPHLAHTPADIRLLA